ncbi:pectin degradation protein kdgF [Agarivorans sp. OAG1]|jgi:quercetin dioxygenase-like cupin family protein|uniref:Pectin degradation protein KdgF n=1 Tax=Agarivorans albus MKT 106 TaxID=1331007 RepID=R9PUI4_AGAAL|nr:MULTISPECIES: cupin domain-containing protein [Agarivorans]MPW29432.1 cupin domain-containing protein [Agarivorans sp. B2Z047]UQN45021.1 cupin domain-containing protein [Agarivorans sp. B2Z047]BEU03650.1 pectin degradation protein kdgF [Agarivorans sp. OAG1]GAD04226.1 pectin degradation protein KdgF [Agarivorans albus MKT 106]
MTAFFNSAETPWDDLGDGVTRKIVGHTDQLMVVHVRFEKGAIGAPHAHEFHDQIGYVAEGSFEAEINGEKRIVKKGDAYIAPRTFMHGAVALEEGSVLVDCFSPPREDFLS